MFVESASHGDGSCEPRGRFLWQQDRRSLATRTVPVAHKNRPHGSPINMNLTKKAPQIKPAGLCVVKTITSQDRKESPQRVPPCEYPKASSRKRAPP